MPQPHFKQISLPESSFNVVKYILAVGWVLLVSGCGVNRVVPAGDAKWESRGASYYLPRTVVVATIPVEKVTTSPGDFAPYSAPLLGIPSEVSETSSKFGVGETITIDLTGEKDPDQRFIALYPKGPFKTFTQTLNLNDQGVLTKGDAMVDNKTVEFVVSSLEAAAKIAGSAIKPAGGAALFPDRPGLDKLQEHVNALDKDPAPDLSIEGLRAGLSVLLADRPDQMLDQLKNQDLTKAAAGNWEAFAKNAPKGLRNMTSAIQSYKEIAMLGEKIEGAQSGADVLALRSERNNQLGRFISKKTEKTTWVGQFRWTPAARHPSKTSGAMQTSATILVVDANRGIISAPGAETPPGASMKDDTKPDGKNSWVSLICESSIPEQTAIWQSLAGERKKHGWHYRIPAQSKVVAMVNDERRMTKRCNIGQHGCIAFLPATSAGQKVTSNIELDPVSGALKSTTFGGTSFDPGLINRTGAAISSVMDADKARDKAEDAANDPLTQLQRKKNLLQLTKDIKALEANP